MSDSDSDDQREVEAGGKRAVRRWTPEEHAVLASLVAKQQAAGVAEICWSQIAKELPNRTGKQCRHRWINSCQPNSKRGVWDLDEEHIVAQLHAVHGSAWSLIASKLNGRSENSVKNHYNALLRSKYLDSKRESVLANYVRLLREGQSQSQATYEAALALTQAHREEAMSTMAKQVTAIKQEMAATAAGFSQPTVPQAFSVRNGVSTSIGHAGSGTAPMTEPALADLMNQVNQATHAMNMVGLDMDPTGLMAELASDWPGTGVQETVPPAGSRGPSGNMSIPPANLHSNTPFLQELLMGDFPPTVTTIPDAGAPPAIYSRGASSDLPSGMAFPTNQPLRVAITDSQLGQLDTWQQQQQQQQQQRMFGSVGDSMNPNTNILNLDGQANYPVAEATQNPLNNAAVAAMYSRNAISMSGPEQAATNTAGAAAAWRPQQHMDRIQEVQFGNTTQTSGQAPQPNYRRHSVHMAGDTGSMATLGGMNSAFLAFGGAQPGALGSLGGQPTSFMRAIADMGNGPTGPAPGNTRVVRRRSCVEAPTYQDRPDYELNLAWYNQTTGLAPPQQRAHTGQKRSSTDLGELFTAPGAEGARNGSTRTSVAEYVTGQVDSSTPPYSTTNPLSLLSGPASTSGRANAWGGSRDAVFLPPGWAPPTDLDIDDGNVDVSDYIYAPQQPRQPRAPAAARMPTTHPGSAFAAAYGAGMVDVSAFHDGSNAKVNESGVGMMRPGYSGEGPQSHSQPGAHGMVIKQSGSAGYGYGTGSVSTGIQQQEEVNRPGAQVDLAAYLPGNGARSMSVLGPAVSVGAGDTGPRRPGPHLRARRRSTDMSMMSSGTPTWGSESNVIVDNRNSSNTGSTFGNVAAVGGSIPNHINSVQPGLLSYALHPVSSLSTASQQNAATPQPPDIDEDDMSDLLESAFLRNESTDLTTRLSMGMQLHDASKGDPIGEAVAAASGTSVQNTSRTASTQQAGVVPVAASDMGMRGAEEAVSQSLHAGPADSLAGNGIFGAEGIPGSESYEQFGLGNRSLHSLLQTSGSGLPSINLNMLLSHGLSEEMNGDWLAQALADLKSPGVGQAAGTAGGAQHTNAV